MRSLAALVCEHLYGLGFKAGEPRGMRLPVLRETRMPAVLCELGPVDHVAQHAGELADALALAVRAWVENGPDQPP